VTIKQTLQINQQYN